MTNTKQQTNENLRVLILPQADIQRLQALLAQEISLTADCVNSADVDYRCFKKQHAGFLAKQIRNYAKQIRNYISSKKKKLNNLANLQYKLKHQTLYPLNAAVRLSSVYGSRFYD